MKQGISPAVAIVIILIVIIVVVAAGYFLFMGKGGKVGQDEAPVGDSAEDMMGAEAAVIQQGGEPGEMGTPGGDPGGGIEAEGGR